MSEFLTMENIGDVRIVRFARPEFRNPLSVKVVDGLYEIVREISASEVRYLIFTGAGEAFASGANLNEIAKLDAEQAPKFARRGQNLMASIADLSQITIAAINGYCFGGALDLALACKRRVASPNALFAHPGSGLGIITGWGGTQRLPRLVGTSNSLEMFFTASPIDAKRAFAIGLIDEIADNPLARILAFVSEP